MDKDELNYRLKSAMILLNNCHSLNVGELTFGSDNSNHLSVTGWTLTNNLENITKESALNELFEIKTLFSKMVNNSTEFAEFIKQRQIEYYLAYDYGMGGIGLCSEIDGQIKWETILRD